MTWPSPPCKIEKNPGFWEREMSHWENPDCGKRYHVECITWLMLPRSPEKPYSWERLQSTIHDRAPMTWPSEPCTIWQKMVMWRTISGIHGMILTVIYKRQIPGYGRGYNLEYMASLMLTCIEKKTLDTGIHVVRCRIHGVTISAYKLQKNTGYENSYIYNSRRPPKRCTINKTLIIGEAVSGIEDICNLQYIKCPPPWVPLRNPGYGSSYY